MRFIIEQPIITENSIEIRGYSESDEHINFAIAETNIKGMPIKPVMDRCFEAVGRLISSYYLPKK